MAKSIVLTIAGTDISFSPDMATYNKYINEMSMSNKVAPAHNFLIRIVEAGSKEALLKIMEQPGATLQIVGKVLEEYTPELEITVKN
ncbi:putative phage tail assembly chaperone [Erwinia sp. AnSW2-5]|uniref:putative phage tail assembly chaperone n=1 Tax=Erwinia sp. AnSW2-5 TaxID=3367692 RepID=UPI00385D9191